MKSSLSSVCRMGRSPAHAVWITLHYQHGQKFAHPTYFLLLLAFFLMPVVCESRTPEAEKVLSYLKSMGNGSYMFGQMATWVHNENPDMDHPTNWLRKVYDHTGKMPRYGCVTYDFHDDPFPDSAWNNGVKEMWDRGMIVGVFTFYANPSGKSWNGPVDIDPIFCDVIISRYERMTHEKAKLIS